MLLSDELKKVARDAAVLTRIKNKTSNNALKCILEGIRQFPIMIARTLQVLSDMQDEWPMPEAGQKLLAQDLERWVR